MISPGHPRHFDKYRVLGRRPVKTRSLDLAKALGELGIWIRAAGIRIRAWMIHPADGRR